MRKFFEIRRFSLFVISIVLLHLQDYSKVLKLFFLVNHITFSKGVPLSFLNRLNFQLNVKSFENVICLESRVIYRSRHIFQTKSVPKQKLSTFQSCDENFILSILSIKISIEISFVQTKTIRWTFLCALIAHYYVISIAAFRSKFIVSESLPDRSHKFITMSARGSLLPIKRFRYLYWFLYSNFE